VTSFELTKEIVRILDNKKADNIEAIKVRDLTIVADYFVIASATNTTHVKALADEVEYVLNETKKLKPTHVEGYQYANWIVLDYGDVVVHIFFEETRNYYNLERLWSDGEQLNIEELIDE
jgi:ribosome-associated protein